MTDDIRCTYIKVTGTAAVELFLKHLSSYCDPDIRVLLLVLCILPVTSCSSEISALFLNQGVTLLGVIITNLFYVAISAVCGISTMDMATGRRCSVVVHARILNEVLQTCRPGPTQLRFMVDLAGNGCEL